MWKTARAIYSISENALARAIASAPGNCKRDEPATFPRWPISSDNTAIASSPSTGPGSPGSICACFTPSSFAARQDSVATWIAVPDAATRPSHSAPAVIGIARSVRPTPATSGWRNEARNYCQSATCMSCLRCRTNFRGWRCRTRRSSTTCCSAASAATLLEVARDPKHLGAEIGFLSVLHTWGQNLLHHPHIHCVIPSGGLSPDHQHWIHPRYAFFLPVRYWAACFAASSSPA